MSKEGEGKANSNGLLPISTLCGKAAYNRHWPLSGDSTRCHGNTLTPSTGTCHISLYRRAAAKWSIATLCSLPPPLHHPAPQLAHETAPQLSTLSLVSQFSQLMACPDVCNNCHLWRNSAFLTTVRQDSLHKNNKELIEGKCKTVQMINEWPSSIERLGAEDEVGPMQHMWRGLLKKSDLHLTFANCFSQRGQSNLFASLCDTNI